MNSGGLFGRSVTWDLSMSQDPHIVNNITMTISVKSLVNHRHLSLNDLTMPDFLLCISQTTFNEIPIIFNLQGQLTVKVILSWFSLSSRISCTPVLSLTLPYTHDLLLIIKLLSKYVESVWLNMVHQIGWLQVFYLLLSISYLIGNPSYGVSGYQTGVWSVSLSKYFFVILKSEDVKTLNNMETIFLCQSLESILFNILVSEIHGITEDPSMNYVILQADLTPSNFSTRVFKFLKLFLSLLHEVVTMTFLVLLFVLSAPLLCSLKIRN